MRIHPRASSFGGAADAYERARPGYPDAAVDAAAERLGLTSSASVLDLAAGTGKLTRSLARRFAHVSAVEPIDNMRAVLQRAVPEARALAGTAEAIPLDDGAVDAVWVGEAFHWFDVARAVPELARVVRGRGGVAVLYNRKGWADAREPPWVSACHAVFQHHRTPDDGVDPHDTEEWRAALAGCFGALQESVVEHVHAVSAADVVALYASFSGIAGLTPDARAAALAEIREVLDRHAIQRAEVSYRTVVVTARRP